MDILIREFGAAQSERDGYQLSRTLTPDLSADRLRDIWRSCNFQDVDAVLKRGISHACSGLGRLPHDEVQGWVEVYKAYWSAIGELIATQETVLCNANPSWTKVYKAWSTLLLQLKRGYETYGFEAWTIPCLYVVCKHMPAFAIKADKERAELGQSSNGVGGHQDDDFDPELEKNMQLMNAASMLKDKIFNLCNGDRAPIEQSRKWGVYYIANLIFKTCFRLRSASSVSLCNSVLVALTAGRGDVPELRHFPKAQQVTFMYYRGILQFLEEKYIEAEGFLDDAWRLCHKDARKNQELILTYLIPCHLLHAHSLPTEVLLKPFPRLQKLFLPLCLAIKKGDLRQFDLALQEGEDEFVKRRIYLTLERGRDLALRNLVRKVFLVGGFEEPKEPDGERLRRTRVPIAEFAAAITLSSGRAVDNDEVECYLANMIYKGHMKGYIARDRGMVVLSKKKDGVFPGTGV